MSLHNTHNQNGRLSFFFNTLFTWRFCGYLTYKINPRYTLYFKDIVLKLVPARFAPKRSNEATFGPFRVAVRL